MQVGRSNRDTGTLFPPENAQAFVTSRYQGEENGPIADFVTLPLTGLLGVSYPTIRHGTIEFPRANRVPLQVYLAIFAVGRRRSSRNETLPIFRIPTVYLRLIPTCLPREIFERIFFFRLIDFLRIGRFLYKPISEEPADLNVFVDSEIRATRLKVKEGS